MYYYCSVRGGEKGISKIPQSSSPRMRSAKSNAGFLLNNRFEYKTSGAKRSKEFVYLYRIPLCVAFIFRVKNIY